MTSRIIEPGTFEAPAGDLPALHLPERDIFRLRAARLRTLAEGHAIGDYLRFLADLAATQDRALADLRNVELPSTEVLARCREHGLPPLGAGTLKRDPVWRAVLAQLLADIEPSLVTDAARATVSRLAKLDAGALERLADLMLAQNLAQIDRAAAPFVAAALQVYWLHMVTSLGPGTFAPLDTHAACPCCGSAPVASMVRIGAKDQGLRYLTCSLCGTQWHVVRVKCAFCETTKDIRYYGIEGGSAAIKAERCDSCQSYLKILYMDKDPDVEAVADDVASLTLDVLMAEAGAGRGGLNYYLIGGDE